MSETTATLLTTLNRKPDRGSHDRATIAAILDEAVHCHVAYAVDGQAHCIPMVFARVDDTVFIHGSAGNRSLLALRDGAAACITVSLLDGLVLARSAFRTSVNYRSVMVFGKAVEVTDAREKQDAMHAIVESVVPGRWDDVRPPSDQELRMIRVLRFSLNESSAKLREGLPADDEADFSRDCWAGVIPLRRAAEAPIDDIRLPPGVRAPRYVTAYARPFASVGGEEL